MNTVHRSLAVLFIAAALTACGASDRAEQPPAKDNALQDIAGTMDKARAVEDTTMEHKEGLDRAMDAAEGSH